MKPVDEEEFISACLTPLRKSIRVNSLKVSLNDFYKIAESYQLKLNAIPWCKEGFWVETEAASNLDVNESLGNLPEHIQGLFYIQEASSMLPPIALLNAEKLESPMILDLAAAPGSKTSQMAAMVNNQGLILANELSASRVKVLYSNLVRCGVSNTCMSQFDGRKLGDRLEGLFDYVLLDAPCGGEGTIRKDPQALVDWNLDKVVEISELQKELILTAYRCLKPGGKLVYSTCTLSPEENQQVANYLVEHTGADVLSLTNLFDGAEKATTKEGYLHVLPHIYDSEGFFVAAFSKPLDVEVEHFVDKEKTPFEKISGKNFKQLASYYKSQFALGLDEDKHRIKQRKNEIWIFPTMFDEISGKVRLNRSGLKIADIYPNKLRTTHEFAMTFLKDAEQQVFILNKQQTEAFLKGRDVFIEDDEIKANEQKDGELILKYRGHTIGLGRKQKSKIKNMLPRDLVKDQIKL